MGQHRATPFAPIRSLLSWLVFLIKVGPSRAPIRKVANSSANDPHDQAHRFALQQPRLRWRQQQRHMGCSHGTAMEAPTAQWCDDTKALANAYIPRCSFFSRTGIDSLRRRHIVTRIHTRRHRRTRFQCLTPYMSIIWKHFSQSKPKKIHA